MHIISDSRKHRSESVIIKLNMIINVITKNGINPQKTPEN